MSGTDTLDRILEVQEIDIEIAGKEERLQELPRRRAEVASEIHALEEEQAEHREGLERARVERRTLETEVESLKERLARYETQLNEVKTNVAYSALLTEMRGVKTGIADLEDRILVLMEEIESHENRLEELKAELAERREESADELEALDRERAELEQSVGDLDHKRDRLAEQVEADLLRMYDRLRRARRFPALVPLRGRSCGSCHSRLPPQVVQQVAHHDDFHVCEACGVLVYRAYGEEEGDGRSESGAVGETARASLDTR